MSAAARAGVGVLALALLAYPFVFYRYYDVVGLPGLSLLLGVLALGRVCTMARLPPGRRATIAVAIVAFVLTAAYWRSSGLLKLYPVAVNALLLGYGLYTLSHPPSAIERLVVALGQPVSDAGVGYTRGVTIMWCGFFALNGTAAAYTALAGSTSTWAWYNGMISYGLAAALFAGELIFRGFYRRRVARSADADRVGP